MGDRRSKEDDVNKISSSIFVTNFPDNFSAKELWKACSQYGSVVDSFIPNRRSTNGKRFGFIRFIKVVDTDPRYQRDKLHSRNPYNKGTQNGTGVMQKNSRMFGSTNSYAHAVKIGPQTINEKDDSPAIVLDDTCINQKYYSNALMGKVKELSTLTNLKVALGNEGFDNIKLKYMGGFWVLIEFKTDIAKEMFKSNLGIGIPLKVWSKNTFFHITSKWGELVYFDDQEEGYLYSRRVCIKTKLVENIVESFKIINRGKTYWIRAKEVTGWIPDFMEDDEEDSSSDDKGSFDSNNDDNGNLNEGSNIEDDSDMEVVEETIFEKEQSSSNMKENVSGDKEETHSADPFNIYELLNKNKDKRNGTSNSGDSLKYPPGYTPNLDTYTQKEGDDHVTNDQEDINDIVMEKFLSSNRSNNDTEGSKGSGHFQSSEVPRNGGSIL
ncbi:nucleotide-binding alpha-beta plait domain-containing protein [Tanacetum coccineum]